MASFLPNDFRSILPAPPWLRDRRIRAVVDGVRRGLSLLVARRARLVLPHCRLSSVMRSCSSSPRRGSCTPTSSSPYASSRTTPFQPGHECYVDQVLLHAVQVHGAVTRREPSSPTLTMMRNRYSSTTADPPHRHKVRGANWDPEGRCITLLSFSNSTTPVCVDQYLILSRLLLVLRWKTRKSCLYLDLLFWFLHNPL